MNSDKKIAIQLRKFEKWYGEICAVKPIVLDIVKGETFALLGPNGSGKSTVIRALAGLHFPTNGQILINGMDISVKPTEVKKVISYMPQRVTMPDALTAREVVTLYARLRKVDLERVDEILDFVELAESADRFTREYSGGMLQRVGLAIAFLSDVEIYVLDEPTLNLDPLGIKRLRERILELKKRGKTILFSSHILQDAVELADRVGILANGRMAKIESIPEFKKEIARETRVRIVLSKPLADIQKIIEAAGAEKTCCNSRSCTFKAEPDSRLSIIRAIESAGVIVEEFHTDPPNWEALLHQDFQNNK
jgi:ABC-type multidrug transport system ATPase subunit